MKYLRFLCAVLLCAALCLCFDACRLHDDTSDDTLSDPVSDTPSDTVPELPQEDPTDGPASLPETEPVTEPATEPETEALRLPTDPASLTFARDERIAAAIAVKDASFEIADAETGSVLRLRADVNAAHPRVEINYADCMRALSLEPLPTAACRYLIIRFRVLNGTSDTAYLHVKADGDKRFGSQLTYSYDPAASAWQYMVFGSGTLDWSGGIGTVQLEFFRNSRNPDEVMEIDAMIFSPDLFSTLSAIGMEQYLLGHDDALDAGLDDPVTYRRLTAPDEDASVDLWFDHITEKTAQDTLTHRDMPGYTIQMARNEIEDCQFFVAPASDRTLRVEISDFTDDGGHTADVSLYYMYYTNVAGAQVPDAIPPVAGPLTVRGGTSQGFVLRAKTTADTPAGLYRGRVDVYDDATGKHIKTAEASVRVFDVTLSDETRLRTAMEMLYWKVYHTYPEGTDTDQLAINYYQFLLENRINPYQLPYGVRDSRAWDLIADPRLTAFTVPGVEGYRQEEYERDVYRIFSEHEGFLDKAYFYRLDEPMTAADLNELQRRVELTRQYYPGARWVAPCYVNIDVNGEQDEIAFLAPLMSIWCYKFNAFTPRELAFVNGASFVTSEAQDEKFGPFYARMQGYMDDGYELWSYFTSGLPDAYANFMCDDDGTGAIVGVWQCKLYGCTGLLYWGVNYWNDDMLGDVTLMANGSVRGWGDGILIYSGAPFGIMEPVSSLRLETIRDGIEDYQLLCMLEDACGKETADAFVRLVTTSAVTFTTDDDYLAAVRVLLKMRVEAAAK